ncbi:inositol monophosphatase [bacterium]|nr:inositol monophosphatase [bacterium]
MHDPHIFISTARNAALEAGEILRDGFGRLKSGDVALKGFGDYVTAMDHASEKHIISLIRRDFPDHRIMAEESGSDGDTGEYRWLIDPLDGTANYVHGIPFYSVSIAIEHGGRLMAGVVYHVELNEMFSAEPGQGAMLNGEPVRVSDRKGLDKAMLGTGFPWRSKPYIGAYMDTFQHLFMQSAGMRRMGSAAIDLSYVACGRLDGFWEMHLRPYDIGAGILMVREAGGVVSDFNGADTSLASGNVVAANPEIHRQMLEITGQHLSDVPGVDAIQAGTA